MALIRVSCPGEGEAGRVEGDHAGATRCAGGGVGQRVVEADGTRHTRSPHPLLTNHARGYNTNRTVAANNITRRQSRSQYQSMLNTLIAEDCN